MKKGKNQEKSALRIMQGVEQPDKLNTSLIEKIRHSKQSGNASVSQLVDKIISGDRVALAKAITLVESNLEQDKEKANALIEKCLPLSGNSIRIGITGVPGVGKSTFIEALGMYLIEQGYKVAVLAVDPSSERSKGSILGDKTRMERLSSLTQAFIRPSPSGGTLGGVTRKSRETIVLCEAAGYNVICIETVGVGQSEVAVKGMVDFFLLLMLAGAGDELQGIKRGIMEMADAVIINKADGENINNARTMVSVYQNALHYMLLQKSEWVPKVEICSSLTGMNIPEIWQIIREYYVKTLTSGYFDRNRKEQNIQQLHSTINNYLHTSFYNDKNIQKHLKIIEEKILNNFTTPYQGAKQLIELYRKN